MNALLRSTLALGLAAALSACSILPEATPTQVLDPRLPAAADAPDPAGWTLDVARPDTDPVRDSNRVLVRTADGRLQVHGTARWAAATPDLLRTLLVRRLRDRQLLTDAGVGSGGDRLLAIDLRRFELDDAGALEAVVVFEARIHDAPRYKLHQSRLFERRQAAASVAPGDINDAFETVLAALIDELAAWMLALPDPD